MGILRADRITGLGGANAIKGSVYLHGGDDSSGSQTMNMKDSSLAIGTNEFCCDFWIYWVDIPSYNVRVVGNLNQGDYSNAQSWTYLRFADGTSRLWNGSSYVSTGADNFVANRWYHIAVVRNSGNYQALYIDGSMQSTTVQNTNDLTNDEFDINGRASDGAESARIFFSNVRLTIGSGAAELGGIVPVGESEVLADTKILCCNSPGNILNESAQGIPITTGRNSTANASVGTASRFTPNSPVGFSTTTDVGSQYGSTFDGFGSFATSTYMVPPGGNTRERNRGRAVFGGGESPTADNVMEYINIQSGGRTFDFGDHSAGGTPNGDAVASSTRGVFTVHASPNTNALEFITIANTGNSQDFGDQTTGGVSQEAAASNSTRGLFAGGIFPGSTVHDTTEYITIATLGNAIDFGNLIATVTSNTGVADATRALFAGGIGPSSPFPTVNRIEYFTIANTGNATDFGDLTFSARYPGSAGDSTRGVFMGGATPSAINTICFVTIQTTGNATDYGDLVTASHDIAATSNNTRAIMGGGGTPSRTNTIEQLTIQTTGNALDFGDLSRQVDQLGVCSDSHGGIS